MQQLTTLTHLRMLSVYSAQRKRMPFKTTMHCNAEQRNGGSSLESGSTRFAVSQQYSWTEQ